MQFFLGKLGIYQNQRIYVKIIIIHQGKLQNAPLRMVSI